ncbi:hypothetical protein [Zavarzinia sp.]|uniref:hypothetical protein n=1 Tax=Zavarzinia sp. TaxID=2027920 RepID=UPI0035675F69
MTLRRAGANQLDLAIGPVPGALASLLNDATASLAALLHRSPLSRYQIAEQLTYLLGRKISDVQLNAWVAQSNANRMPADVLVCLCRILGSAEPLDKLFAGSPWVVSGAADRAYAELGRCQIEGERIADRAAAARRALLKDAK